LRWWPFLGAQGLLDAGGYLALFAGSTGEGQAIAAVAGSGFGAVTVLLACLVLKERMSLLQWLGIALVFGGVAVLAGQG
jgi:drug/metabolite transporter (DMT)-like permease